MSAAQVIVPEGTDFSDPYQRAGFETKVKARCGPYYEVLWPKVGEQVTHVLAVDARPGAMRVKLGHDYFKTDGLGRLVARLRDHEDLQLVEVWPSEGYGIACTLDKATVDVRSRLATVLRCDPWDVEVVMSLAFDEKLGRERIDKICVVRAPMQSISAEKRLNTWRELIAMLSADGGSGWTIDEDPVSGQVQLSYGTPRRLPEMVSLDDLTPDSVRPDEWDSIPLGIGANGKPVGLDLPLGPHGLTVGPTGTGKTILLLNHATNALARGHKIVLIDPTKAGLDFLAIRPWCAGWADTLASGQAMVETVYAEVARRKTILQELGEVKWSDINPEMRRKHQIVPITVIIDEYGSLVLEETVPKSLPKDHPFKIEADERNASRAIISSLVGRIAREARFAGIHLQIALQRPDAGIISGELRSNLTSAVQLAAPGKPLSREALTMVFPGETGGQAAEALAELDDGKSRGLAVMAAEGGQATGFRVGFMNARAIPELLERIGVALPVPFDVKASATPTGPGPEFVVIPKATPAEVDLGSMDFSLDEFEDIDTDGDTTESPRPAPTFAPPTHNFEVV